ncbi:hypothetical protein SAMN02910456_02312 [Ruminococcaceae bacterium YRB3002]|nr:hypothetical protein SAMN02910456_02312 [Ruminococcaceae bacterium YRB3002]
MNAAKTVIRRLYFSVVIWIIIASLQILIGLPLLLVGYGVSMILCGGWNIYASVTRMRAIDAYKAHPELIYPTFEADLNHMLIFLGINLIFGGVIGVIASVYDLVLRDYVMKHRDELMTVNADGGVYGEL